MLLNPGLSAQMLLSRYLKDYSLCINLISKKTKISLAMAGKCHSQNSNNYVKYSTQQDFYGLIQCSEFQHPHSAKKHARSRGLLRQYSQYWDNSVGQTPPASSREWILRPGKWSTGKCSAPTWGYHCILQSKSQKDRAEGSEQRLGHLQPALSRVRWSALDAIFTFAKKAMKLISRHPWMIQMYTDQTQLFSFQNGRLDLLGIRSSSSTPRTAVHMWLKKLLEKDRHHGFLKPRFGIAWI